MHDGQICVPYPGGKLRLAHPRARYTRGLYERPGGILHVSAGLGTTFVPFRFAARRGDGVGSGRRVRWPRVSQDLPAQRSRRRRAFATSASGGSRAPVARRTSAAGSRRSRTTRVRGAPSTTTTTGDSLARCSSVPRRTTRVHRSSPLGLRATTHFSSPVPTSSSRRRLG
jgi:hypothetical protein